MGRLLANSEKDNAGRHEPAAKCELAKIQVEREDDGALPDRLRDNFFVRCTWHEFADVRHVQAHRAQQRQCGARKGLVGQVVFGHVLLAGCSSRWQEIEALLAKGIGGIGKHRADTLVGELRIALL